jgi:hypothetical protein
MQRRSRWQEAQETMVANVPRFAGKWLTRDQPGKSERSRQETPSQEGVAETSTNPASEGGAETPPNHSVRLFTRPPATA